MLYRFPQSQTLPPVVKRPFQTAFSNQGLGKFRQRRPFSNVLDEASYEKPEYSSNTEARMPEPIPLDVSRGSRDTVESLTGQSSIESTSSSGDGGGGGGLSGAGTANKIAKWASGSSLTNSVMTESSGKIGVSNSSPAERLDVDGTVKMTGFQLSTGATDTYVLTSNGSGVGTWQAPSGGGGGVTAGFVVAMATAL